jgi:hypothetical protein
VIVMVKLLFVAGILMAGVVSAAAQDNPFTDPSLGKLLPPEPGAKFCYMRAYAATHLKQHPRQTITNVTFFMRVAGFDKGGGYVARNPDHIAYQFAMAVKRRAGKPLRTGGDCAGGSAGILCVVDCDGGGVNVEKLAGGENLMLRMEQGGIRMHGDCDGEGVMVGASTDDKVFQMSKAPAQACAALEKQELGY